MSKRVQRVRFLCLAALWVYMCEGEERRKGELKFLMACPVEMAAVIPLTETVCVRAESAFQRSRFSWRLDRAMGGGPPATLSA